MTTMEEGTVPPIRFWRCHEKERAASGEESRREAASATAPNRGREPRRRCWRCAAKLLPPENIAALPGSTTATVRVPWKEDELGVVAPCLCCRRAPLNPLAWVEYRCLHVIFGVFSYFVLLFQFEF
ncbi:uncharacterized protein [Arachis hypogaea]|uniref:uncharacterized protein isoform X2 n=1 Tax=Arachis hypogaea TaxID=3818 RepID=UPI000DED1A48|nr:uncharacterized protein LOC112754996 isoform X5 [Arachis hypogaea]XP_029149103.1 uncharacterized protein LOC112754996 isoform X5 [Arachis hypogaea]